MSIKTIYTGIAALALVGGLAACGSAASPHAAPAASRTLSTPASHAAVKPATPPTKTKASPAMTAIVSPPAPAKAAPTTATPAKTAIVSPPASVTVKGYVKPQFIGLSGDAGDIITNLTWSGWGDSTTTGTGTSNIQGCVPNCAQGSETPTPTIIVLSDIANGEYTQYTETRAGNTESGSLSFAFIEQTDPAVPAAPADPWAVVSEYYGLIESGNYQAAWNLQSPAFQGTQSNYSTWVNGYACTGTQTLSEISESGDTVYVNLAAVDNCAIGDPTRYFTGSYTVANGLITSASMAQTD